MREAEDVVEKEENLLRVTRCVPTMEKSGDGVPTMVREGERVGRAEGSVRVGEGEKDTRVVVVVVSEGEATAVVETVDVGEREGVEEAQPVAESETLTVAGADAKGDTELHAEME